MMEFRRRIDDESSSNRCPMGRQRPRQLAQDRRYLAHVVGERTVDPLVAKEVEIHRPRHAVHFLDLAVLEPFDRKERHPIELAHWHALRFRNSMRRIHSFGFTDSFPVS